MPSIQIVAAPPGREPEHVRRGWIGLVIPLAPDHPPGPLTCLEPRALHAEKSLLRALWHRMMRSTQPVQGYVVDSHRAIELLAAHQPAVAAWWRKSAPASFQPGQRLLFHHKACLLLDDAGRVMRPMAPQEAGQLDDALFWFQFWV